MYEAKKVLPMTNSLETTERSFVTQEVERYLLTHPYAADSLEGIIKWWTRRQRFEESLDHVLRALDILIAQGIVLKIKNADGTCIYKKKYGRRQGLSLLSTSL